jgi:hypothetical protein
LLGNNVAQRLLRKHRQLNGKNGWRWGPDVSLPPADWPDCNRMFSRQLNFFRFMADHKALALT